MNMLTIADYVKATGKAERTVWRWLSEGQLEGQAMKVDGAWLIPADAKPVRRAAPAPPAPAEAPGTVVAVRSRKVPAALEGLPPGASLAEVLAMFPAFLPLDVAAYLLGISRNQVKDHAEELGAVPYGYQDSLVVPARTVRQVAGI